SYRRHPGSASECGHRLFAQSRPRVVSRPSLCDPAVIPRRTRPPELLAPGEYERMTEHYGERCWICGNSPKTRRLHIDHDHKTGKIRGLLCFRCNRFLAAWMSVEWCRCAARYLDGQPWMNLKPGRLPL